MLSCTQTFFLFTFLFLDETLEDLKAQKRKIVSYFLIFNNIDNFINNIMQYEALRNSFKMCTIISFYLSLTVFIPFHIAFTWSIF